MSKPDKILYDYDFVTNRDKETAEEVINQIEKLKNLPLDIALEKIKIDFKIKEIRKIPVNEGLFYNFFKDEKLGASVQGYNRKKDKEGNDYTVPFITFGADREYLDDMIKRLITKIKNIILTENK